MLSSDFYEKWHLSFCHFLDRMMLLSLEFLLSGISSLSTSRQIKSRFFFQKVTETKKLILTGCLVISKYESLMRC